MLDVSSAPDAAATSPETTTGGSGGGSQHVEKLRKMLFRRMLVGVNDGRYFLRLFHCVDKQGNILLQDAVEFRSSARRRRHALSSPTEQRGVGLILIPAACRSSCHVDCSVEESMSLLSLVK